MDEIDSLLGKIDTTELVKPMPVEKLPAEITP